MNSICLKPKASLTVHTTSGYALTQPSPKHIPQSQVLIICGSCELLPGLYLRKRRETRKSLPCNLYDDITEGIAYTFFYITVSLLLLSVMGLFRTDAALFDVPLQN